MRKYTFLFLLLFSWTAQSQQLPLSALKTGDLIFQDMDCGPLCDAIEAVTEGYDGHDFSHMGLVYIQKDTIYIIEAAGTKVRLNPLSSFSKNTHRPMYVGRLKSKYQKLIPAAIAFSLQQMGVPYDEEYVYDNGKYYCSELIYDAFKSANKNKPFFQLFPMTYKKPGTDDFFPAWKTYYEEIGKEIPEGKPGCNPGGMSTSDKLTIIATL
ncbi:YiiX/YebB-like N1pC/P60 family cysteine hydrolase [Flavobacterium kingsejongi]|uniref:Peptidoglycan peptidase n=1 Tax=Flavobacterium kingsejongi TaxID=1678728 RepID=A0A2S1LMH0_9FLAO|nr:YiiX/YebB-like N1pC/P60 family cysteine hydrolase [Flavobacterium kingsejongi]AWG24942.1 hypothetical protein FK004_06715 [Flavobacterium kingsejongi]